MFDLAKLGVVRWPVTLTVDNGDGTFTDVPVTIAYRVFTRAELRERGQSQMQAALTKLLDIAKRPPPANEAEIEQRTVDLRNATAEVGREEVAQESELLTRITAWSGFGDASGAPIDYTADLGRGVIAFEPHYRALWNGLMEASQQAKPKNSSPGADGATAPGQTTTA